MKIALPLTATDAFAAHYGAATRFVVYDVEPSTRTVQRRLQVHPAENRPCHWPVLLRTAGTDLVLAGSMGRGARQHMAEQGIQVLAGVTPADPETVVAGWLAGTLVTGENACDDGHAADGGPCAGSGHGHGAGHRHKSGCGCSH